MARSVRDEMLADLQEARDRVLRAHTMLANREADTWEILRDLRDARDKIERTKERLERISADALRISLDEKGREENE